jgi:dTDP-D-glucose 4,6-dehydratase
MEHCNCGDCYFVFLQDSIKSGIKILISWQSILLSFGFFRKRIAIIGMCTDKIYPDLLPFEHFPENSLLNPKNPDSAGS